MAATPPPDSILWRIPAAQPPPGVKSNFVNPPSLAKSIIIVNVVFLTLQMIVVAIRFFSKRWFAHQKYDWSDATCLVATLGSIAHSGQTIHVTTMNYGRHLWDIQALSMTASRIRQFTSFDPIYVITTYFIKISLFLLFWQFFQMMTGARRAIQFGVVVITIITIPYLTISCIRLSKCVGLRSSTTNICTQRTVSTTNMVFGACNVLTDLYILAIPIGQLRQLNLPTKRKIGVMVTFLTGFVACTMSLVRLGIIASRFHSKDPLYTAAMVSYFSCVEMKLAIICSCVIYFPAFFRNSKLSSVSGSLTKWSGWSRSKLRSNKSDSSSVERKYERTKDAGPLEAGGIRTPELGPMLR